MSKRRAFWVLTVAGFAALGIGVWQTVSHWTWLDAHRLSGLAILDLVGLGFLAFVIPLHLRGMMDTATPAEMARDVLVRGGLTMLAFNVSVAACTPTLITFHVGHLSLAILGLKFGGLALDKAADWYVSGLEWLGKRIEY